MFMSSETSCCGHLLAWDVPFLDIIKHTWPIISDLRTTNTTHKHNETLKRRIAQAAVRNEPQYPGNTEAIYYYCIYYLVVYTSQSATFFQLTCSSDAPCYSLTVIIARVTCLAFFTGDRSGSA